MACYTLPTRSGRPTQEKKIFFLFNTKFYKKLFSLFLPPTTGSNWMQSNATHRNIALHIDCRTHENGSATNSGLFYRKFIKWRESGCDTVITIYGTLHVVSVCSVSGGTCYLFCFVLYYLACFLQSWSIVLARRDEIWICHVFIRPRYCDKQLLQHNHYVIYTSTHVLVRQTKTKTKKTWRAIHACWFIVIDKV